MSDPTLNDLRDTEDGHQERNLISPDRPPVNDGLPHHEFIPSEFAPESGRCDKCGGGPLAQVHQKPVDQMERIADALERPRGTPREVFWLKQLVISQYILMAALLLHGLIVKAFIK